MSGQRSSIRVILLAASLAVGPAVQAAEPAAEQIIARVDENAYRSSSHARITMIIRLGNRELVKEMVAWGDGARNGLVEFVNAADRGTKYLKLGDDLWMYFPNADDLVRISGHMLRQGFMGSDFSYEDALESRQMQELYRFTLDGVEACGEAECYVLTATAQPGVQVTYALRRMWVDTQLFVVRREELYAAGGRLLKVSQAEEVEEIAGRHVVTRATMEDVLRRGSSTTMIVHELALDVDIPPDLFSLRSLMR